jgi:hypothetical protein
MNDGPVQKVKPSKIITLTTGGRRQSIKKEGTNSRLTVIPFLTNRFQMLEMQHATGKNP